MEKVHKIGKVYQISSVHSEKVYIGSTTQDLNKRLMQHFRNYQDYLLGKYPFVTSFEILKFGDVKIECIEEYEDVTRKELHLKEGEIILEKKNTVNKVVMGRTNEKTKYYEDHKAKYEEYDTKNKANDKIKCECGGEYKRGMERKHIKTTKHEVYKILKAEREQEK